MKKLALKSELCYIILGLIVTLCILIEGCSPSPVSPLKSQFSPLRIAAASDLTKAFKEIGALYEKKVGQKAEFVFGASGQIEKQIESGAPYDVFASANEAYVEQLIAKKMAVQDSKRVFAQGRLGIWVRSSKVPLPAGAKELLSPVYQKIAIANPEFAPYGKAAKEALQSEKVWDSLQRKLVFGENVQQTTQFVQTGNADAALVGLSTITGLGGKFTLLPQKDYTPLKQAIVILRSSKVPSKATSFIAIVSGAEGQAILKKYGLELRTQN